MALNIGDINFGVDADTTGLKRAVGEMDKFRRAIDQTAQSQEKGSSQAASALARQESAIKRAFQQTLNLRRAMKSVGAPATEIAKVTKSFQKLTREMSSGRLSVVQFTRAQDAFSAKMGRSSRTLKSFKVAEAAKRTSRFTEAMRDLESASVLAVGPLSGLGARIRAIGAITSRSTLKVVAFLSAITATTVGVIALIKGAISTDFALQRIQSTLTVAAGSAALAGREFRFVTGVSKQLGLNLESTATQFSQIAAAAKGTSLQGKGVRDIFLGVVQAGAALKLSTDDVSGALRAVQQIISKGVVSSEELRQQFGERVPGALQLAAQAMDVTTQKLNLMLSNGEILATDLLPKLAKELQDTFGAQAVLNARSLQGATENLKTSVFGFLRAFDEAAGVSDLFRKALLLIGDTISNITDNFDDLARIIGVVTGGFLGLVAPSVISGVIALAIGIKKLVRQATEGAAIIGALTGNIKGLIRVALAVGGAFVGFKLLGKDSRIAGVEVERLLAEVKSLKQLSDKGRIVTLSDKQDFVNDLNEAIATTKKQRDELVRLREEAVKQAPKIAPGGGNFAPPRKLGPPDTSAFDAAIKEQEDNLKKLQAAIVTVNHLPLHLKINAPGAKFEEFITRLKAANKLLRTQISEGKDAAAVERELEKARRKGIKLGDAEKARIKNLVLVNQTLKRQAGFISEIAQGFAGAINQGLQDAVFNGGKLKDVLGSILETMAKIAIQAALVKPLTSVFEAGLGSLSAGIGASIFGVPAAAGGGVSSGGVTLVGEKGPELVDLPKGARVTPNSALGGLKHFGGGNNQVVVNVNNFSGEKTKVQHSNDAQGNELINVVVGEVDKRIAGGGSTYQTISRVFNVQRKGIVRT